MIKIIWIQFEKYAQTIINKICWNIEKCITKREYFEVIVLVLHLEDACSELALDYTGIRLGMQQSVVKLPRVSKCTKWMYSQISPSSSRIKRLFSWSFRDAKNSVFTFFSQFRLMNFKASTKFWWRLSVFYAQKNLNAKDRLT